MTDLSVKHEEAPRPHLVMKFLWVPLYFVGAMIDLIANGGSFFESMVAVLPPMGIGCLLGGYAVDRIWGYTWYNTLNAGALIGVLWVSLIFLMPTL